MERGQTHPPVHKGQSQCPYQEALLGLSLLPGPGHLWSLGGLQALVVLSAPEALEREREEAENTVD